MSAQRCALGSVKSRRGEKKRESIDGGVSG
jgi:hypothetical protein